MGVVGVTEVLDVLWFGLPFLTTSATRLFFCKVSLSIKVGQSLLICALSLPAHVL